MKELCAICGCELTRIRDTYARPTTEGRSGASKHHYVPKRFFGRSKNRPGTKTCGIFEKCPWKHEGELGLFCYECHEELLHNPVLLPEDIRMLAELTQKRNLSETIKPDDRAKIAGRIALFHDAISLGLRALYEAEVTPRSGG